MAVMTTKNSFRRKLFFYYFSIFSLFGLILLAYQFSRERIHKERELESSLDQITALTNRFIELNELWKTANFSLIDSIHLLVSDPDRRITLIGLDGTVYYDSSVDVPERMENHLKRPEVQKSLYNSSGSNIRKSATTGLSYYYYSRYYGDYFIRVAAPYSLAIKDFLKTERLFFVVFFFTFFIIWILLAYVTRKMGATITQLREFVLQVKNGGSGGIQFAFPDSELGLISHEIVQMYAELNQTKEDLGKEKERLISHLHALNEGVGFFNRDQSVIQTNNLFIQHLNTLSDNSTLSAESVFTIPEFSQIQEFLTSVQNSGESIQLYNLPQLEYKIEKNGRYFKVQCIIFNDSNFEIILSDITKPEKRRIIKQQMTANIAHELKTPITAVNGYLETILITPDIGPEKTLHFVNKAFGQAERLTELINDIVMLNQIDEAGDHFIQEKVDLLPILNELKQVYQAALEEKSMQLEIDVPESTFLFANKSLVSSVFQNLLENALQYAGTDTRVKISQAHEDANFHYFFFTDNGRGIAEEHLPRIFERFYRVDFDRSRKSGGTGLGLAIVKNAVLLHHGEISVRKLPEGGLEFLFSFPK